MNYNNEQNQSKLLIVSDCGSSREILLEQLGMKVQSPKACQWSSKQLLRIELDPGFLFSHRHTKPKKGSNKVHCYTTNNLTNHNKPNLHWESIIQVLKIS